MQLNHINSENLSRRVLPGEISTSWKDWIDYWAVDFEFKEIFNNQWQSFKTRNSDLEFETSEYEYKKKGKYNISIKVIDIFGNDTTKIIGVNI